MLVSVEQSTVSRRGLSTPLGDALIEANEHGVRSIRFDAPEPAGGSAASSDLAEAIADAAAAQLNEYFCGARRDFSLPLDLRGTPFQRAVWEALLAIPYGQTRSYIDIARSLGRPGGSRAVGGANRANRLPIVVPCHRVVAADGRLGGYALGLDRKARLLRMEAGREVCAG